MNPNLRIAYRHLPPSEALNACIADEALLLETHYGHPIACHVTIESSRFAHPKRCRVRVGVSVRGKALVADRSSFEHDGHDDAYLDVREAFRALRRQLDDRTQKHRSTRHAHVN